MIIDILNVIYLTYRWKSSLQEAFRQTCFILPRVFYINALEPLFDELDGSLKTFR